jgi:hypothetical protein
MQQITIPMHTKMHTGPQAKGLLLSSDVSQNRNTMKADRHGGTNRCMFANFNCECTKTYVFKKKHFHILKKSVQLWT